jgi:hypothetical protein
MIHMRRLQAMADRMMARDIRLLCQARESLRVENAATDDFLVTVAIVRQKYIARVGLKRYISDIIGQYAGQPALDCTAYDASGRAIACEGDDITVLEFLMEFAPEMLPYRLELQVNSKRRITLAL